MLKEQGREENQVRSPRLLLWPDFGSPPTTMKALQTTPHGS